MKQSVVNTTNKRLSLILKMLVVSIFFINGNTFASNKYWIDDISGSVFIQKEGKIDLVKDKGEIADLSHITTEESSSLIFGDSFDHKYQIPGGSFIQIMNKIIQLKRGHIRVTSTNNKEFFEIQSANALIRFKKVDAIINYDIEKETTQVMVIHGELLFANILTPENYIPVSGGAFSFIHKDENEGFPRRATPIGEDSFRKMLAIFNEQIPSTSPPNPILRTIQGLENNYSPKSTSENREGQIIFIPADEDLVRKNKKFTLESFYRDQISEIKRIKDSKKIPLFKQKTAVKLYIFGDGTSSRFKGEKAISPPKRNSPTLGKEKKKRKIETYNYDKSPANNKNIEFEKTLDKETLAQRRHNTEVSNLIEELSSFSQDYQQNH